jgi:hypothetical protein
MWFGGNGLLTLFALALIMLTGGMIIPIVIIGYFGWFFISILSDIFNHRL